MKTVDSSIVAINRCRSHIASLLIRSALKYRIWRFDLVTWANQSITVFKAHADHLLRLGLHIIRLWSGASVGVRSCSHYVRVEFSLRIRACRYSSSTYLWRSRICSSNCHRDANRVEISGSLVHEILSHCHCSPSWTHHRLLLSVNRLFS